MTEFKAALDKEPRNIEYQLKYDQARFSAAFQHFEAGRRALDKQDYQTASQANAEPRVSAGGCSGAALACCSGLGPLTTRQIAEP